MVGIPTQTPIMVKRKIMQLFWVGQEHLRVLLQQPMQIGGATFLGTSAKKIRQPHARPNAPIKLPISSASKP